MENMEESIGDLLRLGTAVHGLSRSVLIDTGVVCNEEIVACRRHFQFAVELER